MSPVPVELKLDGLPVKSRLGKGAGLLAEPLHLLGRVLRLRGVHADQADGVLLASGRHLNGIPVDYAGNLHRARFKLRLGDKRKHPPIKMTMPILARCFDFSL